VSKVLLQKSESYTITIPGDSSVYLGLSREDAVDLLGQLRVALGDYVGMLIHKGGPEPDVPVGTQLLDNEGDTLEKTEEGWKWAIIGGEYQYGSSVYRWETVCNDHSFVVIS